MTSIPEPPIVMRHYNIKGPEMTKGEYRVGIDFNPSANLDVKEIKQQAAHLIDIIEALDVPKDSDAPRLKALAMTAIEEGAMWAVKAATKKPQEIPVP